MGVMFGQQRGDVASKHEFSRRCTRSDGKHLALTATSWRARSYLSGNGLSHLQSSLTPSPGISRARVFAYRWAVAGQRNRWAVTIVTARALPCFAKSFILSAVNRIGFIAGGPQCPRLWPVLGFGHDAEILGR